jgi:hypothetical protein
VSAVLLILAIAAVSAVVVLVSPTRCCARCKGERVTRHRWTGKIIGCPRCKGTGRHYRRGAVLVHRGYHALRAAHAGRHDPVSPEPKE